MDPRARLAGFIKRTFIHSYTQNRKVLGLVVLEEKIILCLPIVSLSELITPVSGPFLTPGAWLAGFIKRLTMHCYTQNMKALDPVVSEKNISLCLSEDPHPPGACECSGPCGFGEDFFMFSQFKSMGVNDPRRWAIFDPRVMVGRIHKLDLNTLLHTKYKRTNGPINANLRREIYTYKVV